MRAIDLACGTAERVPCRDGTFGLAISEYGASLWCDAYRWIPEAARLLVPGGQLVFVRRSPLFALCAPPAGPVSQELVRPQFGLNRLDRGNGAEFYPPHGELLRSLRS
jgi:ubiquinone/menaquinone biosynthesis C-methylase UbiE